AARRVGAAHSPGDLLVEGKSYDLRSRFLSLGASYAVHPPLSLAPPCSGILRNRQGMRAGPPKYCQDYVENKKRDREIVEQGRLAQGWPKLVGGPKQKRRCQQNGLDQFSACRSAHRFMNQPHTGNHGEGKGGEEIMGSCWKQSGNNIPQQQQADPGERHHPES